MSKIDYEKLFKEISLKRINAKQMKSTGKIFPSSAGVNCELQLRYDFLGTDKKQSYVHHGKENKIGNAIHDEIQKDFIFRFKDQVEIEKKIEYAIKGLTIRGKVDIVLGKKLIIELKTVKDEEGKEPDKKHIKQVQWYLGVLGLENAVISYFKRSNGIHIASFELKYDAAMFKQIVEKFERVIEGKNLKSDTRECKFCPYSWTCPSYKRPQWKSKQIKKDE